MQRIVACLLIAFVVFAARPACAAEQPRCSSWQLVNPAPQANHLRDVAYGGGRWVAVGEGTAVISTDATAWTAVPLPGRSLRGVAYGGGAFVAVGAGGAVMRSVDGATWDEVAAPASADLTGVAFAGGAFLAVGADAAVLASSDGLVWTQEWPAAVAGDLAGVRVSGWFAGNPGPMFLVWGPSSLALRRLDGSWLVIQVPAGAVVSQTPFWVNSAICATLLCGGSCGFEACPTSFFATHDGTTWESLCYGLQRGPLDVAVKGRGLVGLHDAYFESSPSTLWTTPDGWSWFEQPSAFNVPLHAIEGAGGLFVAVGNHGAIWASPDGVAWASASGTTIDLDRVAWNDVAFAASGSRRVSDADPNVSGNEVGKALISGSGLGWGSDVTTGLTLAAGGSGIFVAIGASNAYPQSRTYSSVDGREWMERSPLPSRPLLSGTWDGSQFLLLAGGIDVGCQVTCFPNPTYAGAGDGVSAWLSVKQPELLGLSPMNGIAFNGTRYAAIAEPVWTSHRALASEDGLSWRSVAEVPLATSGRQAVATNGSGFVAVRGTSVLTSPDGLAWSSAGIGPLHLVGAMWTGDEYVGVGDDGAGHAAIARSPDGVTWTPEAFPAIPARLLAVAGSRRMQLAVGTAGLTLRRECHPPTPSRLLRGRR